jgi:hypothetical protein
MTPTPAQLAEVQQATASMDTDKIPPGPTPKFRPPGAPADAVAPEQVEAASKVPTFVQDARNASHAAAHVGDQPQEQAAKNVQDAPSLGVSPAAHDVLESIRQDKKRSDLADIYEDSPALASWAVQPGHAAAIGHDDASYLSALEKWATGPKVMRPPTPEEIAYLKANNLPVDMTPQRRSVGNGLFMASLVKGVTGLGLAMQDKNFASLAEILIGPKGVDALTGGSEARENAFSSAKARDEEARRQVDTFQGMPGDAPFVSEVISSLPGMAPMILMPEVAGPIMFAETYGNLRASGVDTGWAVGGATLSAVMGQYIGQKIVSGFASKAATKTVEQVAAGNLAQMFQNPAAIFAKAQTKHAALGWLVGVGMGLSEEAATMLDAYSKTGKIPDVSEVSERLKKIATMSLATLPFSFVGGWKEYHEQMGRRLTAFGDAGQLQMASDLVKATKLAETNPEVLKQVLRHIVDQRSVLNDLRTAADVAQTNKGEMAPALAKVTAKKEGELRAYLSHEAIGRAAQKLGVSPQELIDKVMRNDSQSYTDAQIMKIPISVKLEDFLVDLREAHKELIPGATLDPENSSLDAVKNEVPLERPNPIEITSEVLAALDSKITMADLNRWAEKGAPALPKEAEIQSILSNLRQLGFDLPPLPPLQTGGTAPGLPPPPGQPPGQPPAGGAAPQPAPKPAHGPGTDWKAFAEQYVAQRPLDLLNTPAHRRAAEQARRAMDKALLVAVERLVKSASGAQEGLAAGVGAGESGRAAAKSQEVARTAPKEFPKFIGDWTRADIENAIKQNLPAGLSQAQVDSLSAGIRKGIKAHVEAAKQEAQPQAGEISKDAINQASKELAQSRKLQAKAEGKSVQATGNEVKAGDAMQEYLAQSDQHAMHSAIEKARAEAVTQGDKAREYVKAQDRKDIYSLMYKGKGTGDLYDMILEATGTIKDPRQHPLDLVDAYAELLNQGANMSFDAQHVADVIDNNKDMGSMTLAQAQNIALALKNLKAIAKDSSKAYVEGQKQDREAVITGDILPSLIRGSSGPSVTQKLADFLGPTVAGKILKSDADYADLQTLLQPLGGWGRSTLLWRIKARNEQSRFWEELQKTKAMELPAELKKRGNEDIQFPAGIKANYGFEPKRRDAWRALSMMGTEEGMNSFSRAWGLSPQKIHDWLFNEIKITKEEMDFMQDRHWAPNKELGDRVTAAQSNAAGVPMQRQKARQITTPWGDVYEGGYSPFAWTTKNGLPRLPDPNSADIHGMGSQVSHDFTKERIKKGQEGDRPDIRWDNIASHYRQIAHYTTHDELVREMYHMLNDENFQSAVLSLKGENWMRRLSESYTLIKDDGVQAAKTVGMVTHILNPVKRIVAASVFNYNFPVSLGQFAHPLVTKSAIGLSYGDLTKGMYELAANDGWAFAWENSDAVQSRHRNSFQEVMRNIGEIAGATGPSKLDVLQKPAHLINEGIDTTLTRLTWLAKYHQLLPQLGHEGARTGAEIAVERAMPSRSVLDQSAVVRDKMLGMYLLVRNYPSTIWNINAMDQWDTGSRIASGETSLFQGYGGLTVRRLSQIAGLGFGMYLMGHGRNEEELEDKGWHGTRGFAKAAARSILTEGVYGNLLTHEVMRAFAPTFVGETFNPWSLRLFESVSAQEVPSLIRDAGRFMNGGALDKAVAAIDALGRTLGASLGRSAEGISMDISGDFDGPEGAASQAFYGPRREATPLTDIRDFRKWTSKQIETLRRQ